MEYYECWVSHRQEMIVVKKIHGEEKNKRMSRKYGREE
jgi:hypothetical protein